MKDRQPNDGSKPPVPRAALHELEESLQADRAAPATAKHIARELFAHGLLLQYTEQLADDGEARQERRVRAVMKRLRAEATVPGKHTVLRRRYTILAAAAALLAALLLWRSADPATPVHADALLSRVLQATNTGAHVYEVQLRLQQPSRHKGKLVTKSSTWIAALASGGRWNVRKVKGNLFFVDGAEFGSNGKVVWIKPPTGRAFELFIDPRQVEVMQLAPVLHYYELRPFLETIVSELDIRVTATENTPGGRIIRMTGSYKREAAPVTHHKKRHGHGPRDFRDRLLGTSGRIQMRVDENTGLLLELELKQQAPRPSSFRLRRMSTPKSLADAGFEFDPPRLRVAPRFKFWVWMHMLHRAIRAARHPDGK